MMKKITIFLILLFTGIVLVSGCTSPATPQVPVPGTTVPPTSSTVIPVTTAETLGALSEITPVSPGLPGDAITTVATTRIASDNPYLEYLNVRKRTFADPLPNCLIGAAFPFTKNETG